MRAPIACVLVALAAFVTHARALAFGFTTLDDLSLVADDQDFLRSPWAPLAAFGRGYFHAVDPDHAYYRPMVTASYAVDARLFGAAPWGYHATNVALHAAACALLLLLLRRLGVRDGVAIGAALLFAVHPALTEAIAWIPGRNDTLLALFALASLLAYGARRFTIHLAFFALALFSKESACALPLVCLAMPRHPPIAAWARWAAWAVAIGAFAIARHAAVPNAGRMIDAHALATHAAWPLIALGKIALPFDLAVIATYRDSSLVPAVVASAVALVGGVAAFRSGAWRASGVGVGASLFAATIAPALLAPGDLALENRVYLPAAGVAIALAAALDRTRVERGPAIAAASTLGAALLAITLGYASAFRDPRAFGKAAVAGAPHLALAHVTFGKALQERGDDDAAAREYDSAIALDPREPIAHNNLAVIAMRRGDWARADAELARELEVNPGYATAIDNRAIVARHLAPAPARAPAP